MYNFFMKKFLNKIIISFLKEIIRPFSDSQIRLLQDWLIALSQALFALRSEARNNSLSSDEIASKHRFNEIDKDVHLYGSSHKSSFSAGIEVPTDPNSEMNFTRTIWYRSPLGPEERKNFFLKKFGMEENETYKGSTSYSGIKIINYSDSESK